MNGLASAISAWAAKPVIRDAGLAVLLLCGTLAWRVTAVELAPWWAATGLCLLAVLARHRWPVAALAAATAGAVAHMAMITGPTFADLAAPIVLGTIATRYSRTASLVFLGLTLLVAGGWSLSVALDGEVDGWAFDPYQPGEGGNTLAEAEAGGYPDQFSLGPTDWGALPLFGALIAGWAVGSSARSRREYLDALAARARDLERERDQRGALAAAAERDRITRELHDVVAHGLSVIVMQAQGGAAAFEKRPPDARAALDTIVDTGRASLADMRRVLASDDSAGAPRHPAPGLDRLPQLVDRVRETGTPVRLRVEGPRAMLPTVVDLSAYRIIQESLTNVMKHASPAASADVTVSYTERELAIDVADDGSPRPVTDGNGNGLRGMRDRVALLGGEMSAAPGPHGGFIVRVRLPVALELAE